MGCVQHFLHLLITYTVQKGADFCWWSLSTNLDAWLHFLNHHFLFNHSSLFENEKGVGGCKFNIDTLTPCGIHAVDHETPYSKKKHATHSIAICDPVWKNRAYRLFKSI